MSETPLIIGIDVGRVNLGMSVVNVETGEARLHMIDVTLRMNPLTGKVSKMKWQEKHVYRVFEKLIDDFDATLKKTQTVLVEKQMRREHLMSTAVMIAYLHGKYPQIKAYEVSPRSVRHFFGISQKSYAKNKLASIVAASKFIDAATMSAAALKFDKKDGHVHPDHFEALLLALYYYYNKKKVVEANNTPFVFNKKPVSSTSIAVRAINAKVLLPKEGGVASAKAKVKKLAGSVPKKKKMTKKTKKKV